MVAGAAPAGARRAVEAQAPAPTIENSTLTDHNARAVPMVTGSDAAANAHQPIGVSFERLRASTRINPMAKQIAGLTITVSIQNKGVADQFDLNPVVAQYSMAPTSQRVEVTRSAIGSAGCGIGLCAVFTRVLTVQPGKSHASYLAKSPSRLFGAPVSFPE